MMMGDEIDVGGARPDGEPDATRPRVVVIDEHALVAHGVGLALAERGWDAVATSGPTSHDVIEVVLRLRPDCVLVDTRLGDVMGRGVDLLAALGSDGAHVVMLTTERRRLALAECLEAGAHGWIAKAAHPDDVDATLRRLLAGGSIVGANDRAELLAALRRERRRQHEAVSVFSRLTDREALVLAGLVDGLSAEEIARERFVALTTVRSQIRAILRKFEVNSQLAAVAMASGHRHLLPSRDAERDRRRLYLTPAAPPALAPTAAIA